MTTETALKKEDFNPITDGVIWKQLLTFFFPIMIGTFFQQLYNTADAIIVGRYLGKAALAAAGGSTGVIINLVVLFFVNLSSGASVVISQFFGAQRKKELKDTLHTAIALALAGGVILTAVGLAAAPGIMRLLNTPAEVYPMAVLYLRIFFSGIVTVLLYNIGSAILRAMGDSRRPLYFLIAACFLNIGLDLLFVRVIPLGIAGAALATVIAQAISALLVLRSLMRLDPEYRLNFKEIRFHGQILKRILIIGFPAGIQSSMFNLSNIVVQSVLNGFGTDVIAAWTAFAKIDGLYWMGINAFGVAVMTFSGQNFGAGKYDRIRKSCRVCLGMAAVYGIALSAFLLLGGEYLMRIFTSDLSVIHYGQLLIATLSPFYVTYIFVEVYSGAIRGTGNTLVPMLMTSIGICGLRVLWILLVVPFRPAVQTVLICYPMTWMFTSLLFILYYHRGNWLKHA